MKVVCIKPNDNWTVNPNVGNNNPPFPAFGEICTMLRVSHGYIIPQYVLQGYPEGLCYSSIWFSPTSDIDERERLEAYTKEQLQLTEADTLLQLCADMMPLVEMEPGAFERVWANIVKKEEGLI